MIGHEMYCMYFINDNKFFSKNGMHRVLPPALMHAERRRHHWWTAVTMTEWSSLVTSTTKTAINNTRFTSFFAESDLINSDSSFC